MREASAFVRWWNKCSMFTKWQSHASLQRENLSLTMCSARLHYTSMMQLDRVVRAWREYAEESKDFAAYLLKHPLMKCNNSATDVHRTTVSVCAASNVLMIQFLTLQVLLCQNYRLNRMFSMFKSVTENTRCARRGRHPAIKFYQFQVQNTCNSLLTD